MPRLAEGTRRDIDLLPRKGISVATRCETVEQFVSTFHRWCEDSAIFILNARWPVGTILPFSFELANEASILVGVGKAVEELTTADNRFGRAGVLIAVQKLKRESVAVFKRLLAARNAAEAERNTPPPALARATPAPRALDEVRRQLRPTKSLEVRIPSPNERPASAPRAKTVVGIPAIAKLPTKPAIMQIPTIVPRGDVRSSRALRPPEATPRPVIEQTRATARDAVPVVIEDAGHDTVRDEIPFALRNELRLLETASAARRVDVDLDVDVGWDVDVPLAAAPLVALPAPTASVEPAPEAPREAAPQVVPDPVLDAVPEPLAADDAVQAIPDEAIERAPAASDEVLATPCVDAAASPILSVPASDAVIAPEHIAAPDRVDDVPIAASWWRTSLRWAARVAIASLLFVVAAAITASIDTPSLPAATGPEAPAPFSTIPVVSSEPPAPAPDLAQTEPVAAPEPEQQPPAAAQAHAAASKLKSAPASQKPARALPATRPRRAKARCASLDCL